MRIGLDVSLIGEGMTGIGYSVLELARALPDINPNAEWLLIGTSNSDLLPSGANIQKVPGPGPCGWKRTCWTQTELPRIVRRLGIDLLHCPDISRPASCSVPVVSTVHDLSYYSREVFFPSGKKYYKRLMTHLSVNRSGALATVSEFTRQEVVERFHVSPDRISVIYPGISETVFPPAEGKERPYLFFVGNLERRKNLTRLVEAYAQFRRSSGLPHQLVLAGIPGFGWHQTQEAISTCGFEKDILVPGYLSRDEVLKLYSGAAAFIFPSLYEGFGLPLLEAMSAGIPVACSSVGAVKEVAGSAALSFDPRNIEEIASAIEQVVSSDTLRDSLRQLGYERVKLFSWARCALQYNELYRNTIGAQRTASAS